MTVAFERGEAGLHALAPWADAIVIVDVLSFSTAVDVAAARGAAIMPAPAVDATAAELAQQHDALLAVPRTERSAQHPYTLSPATLDTLLTGARLVLPSPNGAALTRIARAACSTVLVGCLRNASAVAAYLNANAVAQIAVISAGERWPDATLRTALEDDLGAGAVIAALQAAAISSEARYAAAAFRTQSAWIPELLHECASGRELIERGYANDVTYASALDVSEAVPLVDAHGWCRAV